MRRVLLISLIFGAMTIIVSALGALATAGPPGKEMAVVDIPDRTKLLKATLEGKYILVHDDEKMARGEPCFYVYEYSQDPAGQPELKPDKLVVSFHCEPVQHEKASRLVLTYGMASATLFELREIQFAGSSEGHRVP
ncbi:MAG: hypothetical protein AABO57_22135 [Acidobacteriota bacterium]